MVTRKKRIDGHCIGLGKDGKVKECTVEVQGRIVRLTDYMGYNVIVHPSNKDSTEGWCREFALTRDASDVKYFPQMMSGGTSEKAHVEALKKKAGEMSKAAADKDESSSGAA
jgi:hypothetical protein